MVTQSFYSSFIKRYRRECITKIQIISVFSTCYVSIIYFSSLKSHFFYFIYQLYKIPFISLFILHNIILKYHKLSFFLFFLFSFFPHSPHLPQWPTPADFPHLPQRTPADSLPQLHQHQPMTHTCNHSQATIFSIFLLFSSNPQVIKSNQALDSVLKQQKQKQSDLHSVKKQDNVKIVPAKTLILPPFSFILSEFFLFYFFLFGSCF